MDSGAIGGCRTLILVITVVIIAVIASACATTFLTQGKWVSVEIEDVGIVDGDSGFLTLESDVTVWSGLPFDMENLSMTMTLVDEVRGSSMTLGTSTLDSIGPGETVTSSITSELFTPGLSLILRDLLAQDGSILYLRLDVSCGYMHGLVRLSTSTNLDVPLAESGDTVTWDIVNDTDSTVLTVHGLLERFHPEDSESVFQGEDGSFTVSIEGGNNVTLTVHSEGGLDDTLDTVLSGTVTVHHDGTSRVLTADQVEALAMVLGTIRSDADGS